MNKIELHPYDESLRVLVIYKNKHNGRFVFNKEDLPIVRSYTWHITVPYDGRKYVLATIGGVRYFLHNVIACGWTELKGQKTKFLDGDYRNLRRENICVMATDDVDLDTMKTKVSDLGRTGLSLTVCGGKYPYLRVRRSKYRGKSFKEEFSVRRFGFEKALEMAIEKLDEFETKLGIASKSFPLP